MLTRLYVKNIALISEADIVFDEKLNILSGETGSGKSVILESINFVLGSKADKCLIRYGETEALVKAEFAVSGDSEALARLKELDIDSDGIIVISRKYNTDGKGSIKINGNSVTVSMLKSVTQHLVDVHGQSEHFILLDSDNQLKVLDSIAGQEIANIKRELALLIAEKRETEGKIKALGGDEQERERKLDLLQYQINEIDGADIHVGEFDELTTKRNIIVNVEKILNALNMADNLFNGDGGCIDQINAAKRQINAIASLNENYEELLARLENLSDEASDIAETVTDLSDSLNFDEKEAEYTEERLALIKNLRKKYGATEEDILTFRQEAYATFEEIKNSAALLDQYNDQIKHCDSKLYKEFRKLTELRKTCAENLCKKVTEELKSLNIPNAKFDICFTEYNETTANYKSGNGSDKIEFMFSANKGEPLKPLSKVISGGEMSRFMLALKTQLKSLNGITTYIFDEIDAGISGITAKKVAEKFIEISKNVQIIAVSHLPQMCAASDAQFLIHKEEQNGKTITLVDKLNEEQKLNEIIRLTGNVKSDTARSYAQELIAQYK